MSSVVSVIDTVRWCRDVTCLHLVTFHDLRRRQRAASLRAFKSFVTTLACDLCEHFLPRVRSSLRPIAPSLGASGAVLACFAATAVYHPDASVALIFLPMVPFTIGTGLKVSWRSYT